MKNHKKIHIINNATSTAHGSTQTLNHVPTIHSAILVVSGLCSMPLGGMGMIIWK